MKTAKNGRLRINWIQPIKTKHAFLTCRGMPLGGGGGQHGENFLIWSLLSWHNSLNSLGLRVAQLSTQSVSGSYVLAPQTQPLPLAIGV